MSFHLEIRASGLTIACMAGTIILAMMEPAHGQASPEPIEPAGPPVVAPVEPAEPAGPAGPTVVVTPDQPAVAPPALPSCQDRLVPGPTDEVSPRQDRKAEKLARRAEGYCKRGKYDRCMAGYREAYGLSGRSEYLRELGRAYQKNEATDDAACAYQQYIAVASDAADRDAVTAELTAMMERAAAIQRKQAELAEKLARARTLDCTAAALQKPADAPSRKAAREAKKQARQIERLISDRKYSDAVAQLQAVYAIDGDAVHLRDLGSIYEAMNERTPAICSYLAYLGSAGEAGSLADETAIGERVATLHTALVSEQEALARAGELVASAVAAIDCQSRRPRGPRAEPSKQDRENARKQLRQANEFCEQGLFADCLATIKNAYALDGNSLHLFSLGRAAEQMNDRESAICFYQAFLATPDRDPTYAEMAQSRFDLVAKAYATEKKRQADLEKERIERERAAKARDEERKRREAEEEKSKELAKKNEVLDTELTEVKTVAERVTKWVKVQGRSTSGSGRRHLGTALMGVGALGIGVGVLYALEARRASDALSQNRPWSTHFDELVSEGRGARTRAMIFAIAGSASLLSGAALYYLGERASRNVEVELEVGDTGNPVGASLLLRREF